MTDECLDPTTHDVAYSNYDQSTVSGIDQLSQYIKIRLLLVMGELFDNTQLGIDYLGTIFQTKNTALIDALIKSTIKSTSEVIDVVSYSSTFDKTKRTGNISFKASTVYGSIAVNGLELL